MACFRKELSLLAMALCFSVVTACDYPPWAWTPFNSSARPYQQVCKCLDHHANKPGPPFQLSHISGSVVFYGQGGYDVNITCQTTLPADKDCQWKIIKDLISLPIECGEPPNCDQEDHYRFTSDQRAETVCGPQCPTWPFNAGKDASLNAIFRSNREDSSNQTESIWIGYCEPLKTRREHRPLQKPTDVCYAVPDVDIDSLVRIVKDTSGTTAREFESSTDCILRDAARLVLANIEQYGEPVPKLTLWRTGQRRNCTVYQVVL